MKFLICIPIIFALFLFTGCSEYLSLVQQQTPEPISDVARINSYLLSEHQFSISASYLLSHALIDSPGGEIITSVDYSIRSNLNTGN